MSAALNRTFLSLSVPNYRRYFAGQVISLSGNWMQTVAEMWLVVKLTGSRHGRRPDRRAAVPADPGLRRDGRRARRPDEQAQAADRHPGADGAARAGAVDPDGRRPHRGLDGLRARLHARRDQRAGQPGAPELRDRARRPGAHRQRGRAELRDRPQRADRRPGRRRRGDRAARRRAVFPAERAVVRRDDRRALGHGPAPPWTRPSRAPRRRGDLRSGLRLRAPHPGAADPAGDDGAGRDALLQLPDPAAAAGGLHLARHGDHLRAADDRDGRRLRARRAGGGRARTGRLPAARVGRGRLRRC